MMDRNLYGDLGLWMDPGTVSRQMEISHQWRKRKWTREQIAELKARKKAVRQKLTMDWLHDDDDIGDLMYAREVLNPRARELMKQPGGRRKEMQQMAKERGERARHDYGYDT
mmetsp:Transcript_34646/g.67415  ORF Transcript_34646/g.67415 Transcript_34646/m.67415 type:complete len:112 (-) Transcript_34646:69-404(-)